MKLIFFLTLVFCFPQLHAEQRKALIYKLGKATGEPQFVQTTDIDGSVPSQRQWVSEIKDASGKVVMTEKATMISDKITYQYVEQLQINESYELKIEDKKATFKTYKMDDGKKGKEIESKTISIEDSFMTGPVTEFYLQNNWNSLMEGKKLKVEFGVFEVSKAVDFQFKKIKESDSSIEIEMKPANIFFSMFVDPIIIEMSKEKKRITRYKGRTPVREQTDGKWKALDAEITYP